MSDYESISMLNFLSMLLLFATLMMAIVDSQRINESY